MKGGLITNVWVVTVLLVRYGVYSVLCSVQFYRTSKLKKPKEDFLIDKRLTHLNTPSDSRLHVKVYLRQKRLTSINVLLSTRDKSLIISTVVPPRNESQTTEMLTHASYKVLSYRRV